MLFPRRTLASGIASHRCAEVVIVDPILLAFVLYCIVSIYFILSITLPIFFSYQRIKNVNPFIGQKREGGGHGRSLYRSGRGKDHGRWTFFTHLFSF